MNTLFKKITVAFNLALCIALVSCNENSLVTPDKPIVESAQVKNNDLPVVSFPQKYTLTKHGQATLSYFRDGRLQRVTYEGPSAYSRREYSYGAQSIKVISYSGDVIVQQDTYLLDATGRCYESKQLSYTFYSYGTVENTNGFLYQYNDKGQLKTYLLKNSGGKQTEYAFNTDGDLIKVTKSDGGGAASEVTFAYDQPTGDPILADRCSLNSDWTNLPDEYLKIFGKPSKHLAKRVIQKLLPSKIVLADKFFSYIVNADGYVTQEQEFNIFNAQLVATKPYEYVVTKLTVGL